MAGGNSGRRSEPGIWNIAACPAFQYAMNSIPVFSIHKGNDMGFFSWLTSDTKKAIRNIHTGQCKAVYLLQPNGAPPIKEAEYEGYGVFGGIDAYQWLARENIPAAKLKLFAHDDDKIRSIGILIDCGNLLKMNNGALYSIFHGDADTLGALGIEVKMVPGTWDAPIPEYGVSANDLVASGAATVIPISGIFHIRYPIKLSFNPEAKYEDLPAAENDPDQGYL